MQESKINKKKFRKTSPGSQSCIGGHHLQEHLIRLDDFLVAGQARNVELCNVVMSGIIDPRSTGRVVRKGKAGRKRFESLNDEVLKIWPQLILRRAHGLLAQPREISNRNIIRSSEQRHPDAIKAVKWFHGTYCSMIRFQCLVVLTLEIQQQADQTQFTIS